MTIVNRKALIVGAALLGAASLAPASTAVFAETHGNLAAQARITMADAEAIALKARPGKITDEELEKEQGGSGLRYSFDIESGGVTYEVGVDANTGAILENDSETPDADD